MDVSTVNLREPDIIETFRAAIETFRMTFTLPELGLVSTLEPAPPPDPDVEVFYCG